MSSPLLEPPVLTLFGLIAARLFFLIGAPVWRVWRAKHPKKEMS